MVDPVLRIERETPEVAVVVPGDLERHAGFAKDGGVLLLEDLVDRIFSRQGALPCWTTIATVKLDLGVPLIPELRQN